MLVVDTLMQREGLQFEAYDLLHVYNVICLKKEHGTNLYTDNHYLRLWKSQQPQTRQVIEIPNKDLYLNEFVWVSKNWEFQARDDGI